MCEPVGEARFATTRSVYCVTKSGDDPTPQSVSSQPEYQPEKSFALVEFRIARDLIILSTIGSAIRQCCIHSSRNQIGTLPAKCGSARIRRCVANPGTHRGAADRNNSKQRYKRLNKVSTWHSDLRSIGTVNETVRSISFAPFHACYRLATCAGIPLAVFKITGSPFFPEPTIITFAFGDSANFSVASIPFHSIT